MEKQFKLVILLEQLEHSFVLHQYDKYEKNKEVVYEEDRQTLAAIKALIDDGVDLNFKSKTVLQRAVVTNSIELVEMLAAAGFPITEENGKELLYYAAEKGAARVVRYIIEEKGVNPKRKSPRDLSPLSAARSSRYNKEVLAYFIEVMGRTKAERQPPPKKLHELSEENMMKWLPQVSISEHNKKHLHNIIESLFLEEDSVKLEDFYRIISVHEPELIFACIDLIKNAITSKPEDLVTNGISGETHVHHGNLEITGDINILSLMVTGNFTVKGRVSNLHGSQLFVGGNFECENLHIIGPVIIGGNLKATRVETYENNYALEVKQTLTIINNNG